MREFTLAREPDTSDELWFVEHPPVYTLGQAGKREHILNASNIPIVESDRGGQVTYHGPEQLVVYTLLDLRRAGLSVRETVIHLENAVIDCLQHFGIAAVGRRDAPGVYVNNAKIAALGLRIRRGRCYHGLALNVAPDLKPFLGINPCGYAGLEVTSMKKLEATVNMPQIMDRLLQALLQHIPNATA